MRQNPPRTQIYLGVGMFKYQFAIKVAKIYGSRDLASMVYRDTYGGAWWRISDPALISIAHENYGKVVLVDTETYEIIKVYD